MTDTERIKAQDLDVLHCLAKKYDYLLILVAVVQGSSNGCTRSKLMRKLLLVIIVMALSVVPCWGFKQSNEVADITYSLRCFSGFSLKDQIYTNNQLLDTMSEGCDYGTATIKTNGSSAYSSSNKLVFHPDVTGQWPNYSLTDSLTYNSIGTAVFLTLNLNATSYQAFPASFGGQLRLNFNVSDLNYWDLTSSEVYENPTLSPNTDYKFAIVLFGYNSSKVPYKIGDTKASYNYGTNLYAKGGAWSNWTLLAKTNGATGAQSYAAQHGRSELTSTYSNIQIPNYDFSAVLQPTFLDTFTGADGTSLADHTPDVGGAWTNITGTAKIGSNKAIANTYSSNIVIQTIDTSLSDVYIQALLSSTSETEKASYSAIVFRSQGANDHFIAYLDDYYNKWSIYENTSGYTLRADTSVALVSGTQYSATVITNGQNIKAYLNGANSLSYTSSDYVTNTNHGVRFSKSETPPDSDLTTIDNFAIWPLTSATYTSEFAKVGY